MIHRRAPGRLSYGEIIGILKLENYAPFVPGDVANATTYRFPVRYQRVPGLTPQSVFSHDMSVLGAMVEACEDLKSQGVRAITGDCGFMGTYQRELAQQIDLPIFMSSLLQIPFMMYLISDSSKIGIITANSRALDDTLLVSSGASLDRVVIRGLEDKPHFAESIMEERTDLDTERLEAEVVDAALELKNTPTVRLLLLECSMLPPYGAAVQQATGLPVFDYVTMINYVYSAVVKEPFTGLM